MALPAHRSFGQIDESRAVVAAGLSRRSACLPIGGSESQMRRGRCRAARLGYRTAPRDAPGTRDTGRGSWQHNAPLFPSASHGGAHRCAAPAAAHAAAMPRHARSRLAAALLAGSILVASNGARAQEQRCPDVSGVNFAALAQRCAPDVTGAPGGARLSRAACDACAAAFTGALAPLFVRAHRASSCDASMLSALACASLAADAKRHERCRFRITSLLFPIAHRSSTRMCR